MLRSSKSLRIPLVSLLATSSFLILTRCDAIDKKISNVIDSAPHRDGTMKPSQLYLSATGLRKKRIVMVDFNIYSIAVNIASDALKDAKSWIVANQTEKSLVSTLYDKIHEKKDGYTAIAVQLNFLRAVSTSQIVEAFNDSFQDCDKQVVKDFNNYLKTSIGTNGFAVGDTLEYFWLNGGGLLIKVRGEIKGVFFGSEIEKRLLEVYLDPKRTVSPDLYSNLYEFLKNSSSDNAKAKSKEL